MKSFLNKIKNRFSNREFYYLNKLANDLVNPENRSPISALSDRQTPLYRVGKKSKLDRYLSEGIRIRSSSLDLGDSYLNEDGEEELRAYFFSDLNSVMIATMSSSRDQEAIIGNVSKDDEIIVLIIDPQILSSENNNLYIYPDMELSGPRTSLNSVYIASSNPEDKWMVSPQSIIDHKTLEELLAEDEDEYDEYDFED